MGPHRHRHRLYIKGFRLRYPYYIIVKGSLQQVFFVFSGLLSGFSAGTALFHRIRTVLTFVAETLDTCSFHPNLGAGSACGDPSGNRTPVSGVRGRRLDRLTNGPFPRFLPGFYLYPKDLSSGLALLVHLQGLEPGTH